MKRLFALILALMMVASLAITASAEEKATEYGSITINGVGGDTIYSIYRLLDLESYDLTSGAYSYKANADWAAFFATDAAKAYFSTESTGYVTWIWKASEQDIRTQDEAVADFAKLALAYAKNAETKIDPVQTSEMEDAFKTGTNEETGTNYGIFSNLPLGYYLVDSTAGALCGLTTTNPNASVNAKNGVPTIDKQVQEDSTKQWGAADTADIGQIVNYRVTINVHAGAENYVLHDMTASGITFEHIVPADGSAITRGVTEIRHIVPSNTKDGEENVGTVVPAKYYEVVTNGITDGCAFHVKFTPAFCEHLETNDKVVIYYNAMLNRKATIAGEGNVNTAKLSYAEGKDSNVDSVTTYTYGVDIVKTDSQNTLIDGAKFRIMDSLTGGNEVPVVILEATCKTDATDEDYLTDKDGKHLLFDLDNDGSAEAHEKVTNITKYRRARADETGTDIVVCGGMVEVDGLDNGTYYLEETEAPAGYNKLTARTRFIISDANLTATFNNGIYSTGSGVHVVNKSGTMLPETGAAGTAMFITFGMFVMLGTGVLLVTKKRMSMIED